MTKETNKIIAKIKSMKLITIKLWSRPMPTYSTKKHLPPMEAHSIIWSQIVKDCVVLNLKGEKARLFELIAFLELCGG